MKSALLTLALTLLTLAPAQARLGETEQEIIQRFGTGELSDMQRQPGAKTYKYRKDDIQIEVVFDQGKSIWEIYQRKNISGQFPEADIKNILAGYKEQKRNWHVDRDAQNRWEASGKPKYEAYLWPGHEDFFCVKDIAACAALDKKIGSSKAF